MVDIKLYIKTYCPFCQKAVSLLESKNLSFDLIDVLENEQNEEEFEKLKEKFDHHTVPMIFIDNKMIGGFSELLELDENNEI